MSIDKTGSAVFFDRDGVITKPVYSEKFSEYQPPHFPGEVVFYGEVIAVLRDFMTLGIPLIVVSNQPDAAKGKISLENLFSVQNRIEEVLRDNGIVFNDYYYCYHHPDGIIHEFSYKCECRKPNNKFLIDAVKKYSLEPEKCWMSGDRSTDIEFGNTLGLKTAFIDRGQKLSGGDKSFPLSKKPDFIISNLREYYNLVQKYLN